MAVAKTHAGHHHLIDKLAIINGAVSGLALYPQVFVILYSGVQNNFSPLTLWLIVFNNIVWLTYGIHRRLSSVSIAAALSGLAGTILLCI